MKRILMTGAALLALTAPVKAQSQGWYVGAGVGWSWMSGKADFLNLPDQSLNYHSDARFTAALGYKWQGWRAEIEPGWITSDVDLAGYKGGTTMKSLLANLAYDYQLSDRWMLTGGLGAGTARVSHNIHDPAGTLLYLGGHGSNFTWQGIAGIAYALTRNIDVSLEYRYMNTGTTRAVSAVDPARFANGQDQTVMIGVRWYPFATEEAAVSPPAPPPPPPPPPPAPPPPPPPAAAAGQDIHGVLRFRPVGSQRCGAHHHRRRGQDGPAERLCPYPGHRPYRYDGIEPL